MLLGRFFALVVPTATPLTSLDFYAQLGFKLAPDSGIASIAQVVVGDGRLALGLGNDTISDPTFVFVCPGLAERLGTFEEAGVRIESVALGGHTLNHLSGRLPEGPRVQLIEARTHSPLAPSPSVLGWFDEIGLTTPDLDTAHWQNFGFVSLGVPDSRWPRVALTCDSLSLGLHRFGRPSLPWLSFQCDDLHQLRQELDRLGIEENRQWAPEMDRSNHVVIVAPEGTPIVVVQSV